MIQPDCYKNLNHTDEICQWLGQLTRSLKRCVKSKRIRCSSGWRHQRSFITSVPSSCFETEVTCQKALFDKFILCRQYVVIRFYTFLMTAWGFDWLSRWLLTAAKRPALVSRHRLIFWTISGSGFYTFFAFNRFTIDRSSSSNVVGSVPGFSPTLKRIIRILWPT